MDIIISLLLGGFIGWLAGMITKTPLGLLGAILIGIVGSAFGHFLAGGIGLAAYGAVARLAVSVGGAVLLIIILRALGIM